MKLLVFNENEEEFNLFYETFRKNENIYCEFSTFFPKDMDYDLIIAEEKNIHLVKNIRHIPVIVLSYNQAKSIDQNQNFIFLQTPIVMDYLMKIINKIDEYSKNVTSININMSTENEEIKFNLEKIWVKFSVNTNGVLKFNKILEKYSEILGQKIKQSMQLIASELVVDLFRNYKDIVLNIIIKTDEITLEINDKTSEHILFFAKSNADKILENKNSIMISWLR
jgi:hypothetical protein